MLKVHDEQPIVALATPKGSGAIAMIRLSGFGSVEIIDSCSILSSKKMLVNCDSHTINHGFILDSSKEIIDEVLFMLMRAPKTFTGQDTVEISSHNNPIIIEKIIERLILAGARLAEPGEFTKRAVLEGKIDLLQAEAINEIINAQTQIALKNAMSQLGGNLSSHFMILENNILELIAYCEASFEFLDEEQRDLDFELFVKDRCSTIRKNVEKLSEDFSIQKQIREGVRIALIGSVNAGKSTLFNLLLGKNRAIISPIAGTTRDSIEGSLYKNNIFWTLIDTAGLRQTDELIEKEGIERSWSEAENADVVLIIFDSGRKLDAIEQELYKSVFDKYKTKSIIIANKIDTENSKVNCSEFEKLLNIENDHLINILKMAAKNSVGLELLESAIEQKINILFSNLNSPFLLNERQVRVLKQIEEKLGKIENMIEIRICYELLVLHFKEILELIGELCGKTLHEKVLDKVFNDFCVGK